MIKNDFFNWNRFCLTCKKDFMENWKTMFLRFVMLYAVLSIVFCFICFWDCDSVLRGNAHALPTNPLRYFATAAGIYCSLGLVFSSFLLENMRSKTKRIAFLMTPSTMFEKFFFRFLLVCPIYFLAFILAFQLADFTRVLLFSVFYPTISVSLASWSQLLHGQVDMFADWSMTLCFLSFCFFAQSVFGLGSALWFKRVVVKVFASLVVLYTLFFVVDGTLIHLLFKGGMSDFYDSLDFFDWFANQHTVNQVNAVFFFVVGTSIWVLSYFRFKESEIINRL